MARLVLAVAGGVIGYAVGGPWGAARGALIGYSLGTAYEASQKRIDGPRLSDLRMPGTEYGEPITWFIGAQRMAGQIWWASEKREVRTTTSAGKGSGPKVNTFTYEIDLLIGLNEEDGVGTRLVEVPRVWSNGKLVRNRLTGASDATLSSVFREDLWRRLTVYTGHPDQLPDPTYEEAVGAGNAPAYRGRGTVFIEGLQLDGSGQLPLLTFEALTSAIVNVQTPVLTDVEIARNAVALPVGTIAINSDDVSQYLLAVGQWDTSYSSTLVNVYAIGLDTAFINSRFGGSLVTPVSVIGTFNVAAARITPGHGNSDVPLFVQNELSTTQMFTYTVPDGIRTAYTVGENYSLAAAGENVRFCQAGARIVFGATQIASKKLHLFTVGNGVATSSAILGDYVNSIAILGDYVYAATKNTKEVYKLDVATMTVQATIQRPSYSVGAAADSNALLVVINGQLALIGNDDGGTSFYMWTLEGATWTELSGVLPPGYIQGNDQGHQSIGVVGSLLISGLNITPVATELYRTWIAQITVTPGTISLQTAVEAASYRAFRDATRYDASDLAGITTPVRSAAMTQVEGVRGLLQQLQIAHGFDCVVADKLYFRRRGADTVYTIPHNDLAAAEGDAAKNPFPIAVAADLELPPQIAVQFFNASNDYQTGTELSDRLVLTSQVAAQIVQLGLAMTPAEAKAVADRLAGEAALGLFTSKVSLSLAYAKLEPGDAIAPRTSDGEAIRLRLGRKNDAGGIITFDAVRDDADLQSTNGETDENYTNSTEVLFASLTLWQSLDIPLLRDVDDGPGWVIATKGLTAQWPGAQALLSSNNVDFEAVATINESAVLGVCTTVLPTFANGSALIDHFGTVTVDVGFGELASSTYAAMLADRAINTVRIGSEIVRFITATQTGTNPNVYRLSRLWRGQLGTGWAVGEHEADEEFTLLRVLGGLRNIVTTAPDIGQLRYVKGVTLGTSSTGVTSEEFTDTGIKLKPYAPAHLRAAVAVSGLVTCTWERRTRYSYRWPSTSPVPLGEAVEAYEVDLLGDVLSTLVWDAASKDADVTLSAGDTIATIVSAGAVGGAVRGTLARDAADERFWCGQYTGPDARCMVGLVNGSASLSDFPGQDANGRGYFGINGQKYTGGAGAAYGATFTTGQIVGVRLHAGSVTFYLWNGSAWVSQGVAFTGLTGDWYPAWGPGSTAAGTRSFELLAMDPPAASRTWTAEQEVITTLQTDEQTVDLSAASLEVTLPVAAAALTLIDGVYYGVECAGNTNITLRRLVSQTPAGVVATSPYLGAVLVDAAYSSTDAYTAAYYYSGSAYGNTFVERFSLADITVSAATYVPAVAGDVVGIAHDGTDLWVLEQFSLRLRRLNGTTLAAAATHLLAGPLDFGLAYAGGLLFLVESGDLVGFDPTGSPTISWRTALPAGYGFTRDIRAVAGNVFVSTGSGVHVYDQATGALVLSPGVVAYGASGAWPSLYLHGSDIVCNEALSGQPLVVLDGSTGAIAQRFAVGRIVDLYGSDGTNIFVSGQTSPTIVGSDLSLGYTPLGADLSGYTVKVYQMSETVGRGYPATVTIP